MKQIKLLTAVAALALLSTACDNNLGGGDEGLDAEMKAVVEQYVPNVIYSICLLYTSPSPRDRTRSRMPSSA